MKRAFAAVVGLLCLGHTVQGAASYGLTQRYLAEPYLNNKFPASAPSTTGGVFPPLLSQINAFERFTPSNLVPMLTLIPYGVNTPLWSDAAQKQRWMFVPKNATITFTPTNWVFPPGTVFLKHFEIVLDVQKQIRKRLETRVLVVGALGGVYGLTYRWNAAQTDAALLGPNGDTEDLVVTNGATQTPQTWVYPSRSQCLDCHSKQSTGVGTEGVLGVKTAQLNGSFGYPQPDGSTITDNQIRALNHIGIFQAGALSSDTAVQTNGNLTLPNLPQMAGLGNTAVNMETRVHSYLDANCSHCHNPNNVQRFDGRFFIPWKNSKMVFGAGGTAGGMYRRDNETADNAGMPPLAKALIDTQWISLLQNYQANSFNPTNVSSAALNQITVSFNYAPDQASATTVANYKLGKTDGSQNNTLSNPVFASANRITFTVSPALAAGIEYSLVVNSILDTNVPQNRVWPNFKLQFAAPTAPGPAPFVDTGAPPTNDNFAAAAVLSGLSATGTVFSCHATKEPGEPNHQGNPGGASVWWSWTAPSNGPVRVDTLGSDFDTLLAVYTGSSVSALTLVAAGDEVDQDVIPMPSQLTFTAIQGQTYYIAVDGFNDDYYVECGTVQLHVNQGGSPQAPPNDLFANAAALTGNGGSLSANNSFATKEPGEPDQAGDEGGASVWWTWKAPSDGTMTIDTHGSSFDTTLGVYLGTNVAQLSLVTDNDDDGTNITSLVQFNVASNVTYNISVDGFAGAMGNIVLNYSFVSGPVAVSAPVLTVLQGQLGGGNFILQVDGPAGATVEIHTSSDLIHWSTLAATQLNGQTWVVSDPVSPLVPQRFYRAARR